VDEQQKNELEQAAAEEPRLPFLKDFWLFLIQNKKWWLVPILVILLVMGLLLTLSTTAAAPFIYSLF
jgi:hypothetical protein